MQKSLHRYWPLGIRAQLTLWYITVFSVLLALFGIVFYLHLRSTLAMSFDANLQARAQQIAVSSMQQNGSILIRDKTGELAGLVSSKDTKRENALGVAGDLEAPNLDVDLDALMRVLDENGKVAYSTPDFHTLAIPENSVTQSLQGTAWLGTITVHGGQMLRLYSKPLVAHGRIYGVVQVGISLTPLHTTMESVVLELLFIVPCVLVIGAIGSYWLATRAFAPIERLTATAHAIQGGNLHQRVPIPRANDQVQHLALTFNDMLDYLDNVFTRQRRFTADASHELRTPVAAIRSMTDVALIHEMPKEEYVSLLRDVNGQAERLAHLINDLFTLARVDEGHIQFEQQPVHLDVLANDVVASLEWLATERGIVLNVQKCEPAIVIGDEARLLQMMMNLLENALTYTKRGGKIMLDVEVKGSNVSFTVCDTGIGIAPPHIKYIFERFYRTDVARSRAAGGTGLGLSIVEWIVHMHHGTISVESQLGQGSTFTVVLPLAPEA
jgi:two-component system, OmpR family, sensor kinase